MALTLPSLLSAMVCKAISEFASPIIGVSSDLARLRPTATEAKFARVGEAVARLRQDLPEGTALIGFCGAPWTVATYMVEGQGSADQAQARLWAYRDPAGFARLIELLIDAFRSAGFMGSVA